MKGITKSQLNRIKRNATRNTIKRVRSRYARKNSTKLNPLHEAGRAADAISDAWDETAKNITLTADVVQKIDAAYEKWLLGGKLADYAAYFQKWEDYPEAKDIHRMIEKGEISKHYQKAMSELVEALKEMNLIIKMLESSQRKVR